MKVSKNVSIIEPWPILFIENESTAIVSDLHIGIEDQYEKEGVHVPASFLNEIIDSIVRGIKSVNAKRIVILGDVKHEFGRPEESEWYGVKKLIKEVNSVSKLEVVRGNHDNYIISILRDYNVPLHQQIFVGNYFLTHGHNFYPKEITGKKVIIGHEHPTVSIRDELGIRHRFKACLKTEIENREIIVLPSASRITLGTDINSTSPLDLLSPFLKGKDLSSSTPFVIEPGIAVKRFPPISFL